MVMGSERVCVIGLWHLGLVTSACLADLGRTVIGFDENPQLIDGLRNGRLPIFEPGLEKLVAKGIAEQRLWFTGDPREALAGARYVIIAVDTKLDQRDESDLSEVMAAVSLLVRHLEDGSIVVMRSQIPVGTCQRIEATIRRGRPSLDFGIAYFPENLGMGQSIERFKKADMVVIGSDDPAVASAVEELLAGIDGPTVLVGTRTAEMTKHTLNAFFATCISFANEIANLCDEIGADALDVVRAMHLDQRIGSSAPLRPGLGFGGGALGRELKTLRKLGKRSGIRMPLIEGVLTVNEQQNRVVTRKLSKVYGSLEGLTVGILGLTYKPGTSTLRRSVALEIIGELTALGAAVKAHDPRANLEELQGRPEFEVCPDPYAVAQGSDALVLVTDWPEFRNLDFLAVKKSMRSPVLVDARNMLDAEEMTNIGFRYLGVGRGNPIARRTKRRRSMKLAGKTAIVTGAGRGIGRAIALAFAQEGADVLVASRTLSEVEETAEEVRTLGRHALALRVDISNRDEVQRMVGQALEGFGKVDILVNNAGIPGSIGPLVSNDPEKWVQTVRNNLFGSFFCAQAVLPFMIGQRRGKIINLSGGGATSPLPNFSAYGASKTAVVRLTETLAEEVKGFNIQVNAIAPGAVNTRLTDQILVAGAAAGEEMLARFRQLKETGGVPPERAAALAVFLASEESDGLSGRLISAVWDDWESMSGRIDQIMASDLYTLRRVVEESR